MSLSRFRIVFALLWVVVSVNAQFVDYGTDPGFLKWKYVKTPHYKIIFPKGTDSVAYRYTQFLENVYPHLEKTIGQPVKGRYPVILHPGNMQSNGMVAWAPRRMELITTPSPTLYAQSWDRQLSIHESRHVFQTGRLMRGIFRPLYYLGGEQVSGLADFAVPRWFFEGDAVTVETAMSNTGRGRLPEFNLYYRTRALSGDFFSFDKWFLGSYKDYTGNFYALGYDMTAYARYAYGPDVWEKVTDRYVHRILDLPPFSSALKHYTGVNTQGLFNETFRFLEEEWKEQYWSAQPFTPCYRHSPEVRKYTSYQYPQPLNDSTVIAVKSSLSDLQSLVLLEHGNEKFLTYLGSLNSHILLNKGYLYWTEYVSGLRWTHQNYSVLKSFNLSTRKIRTLTPGKRYLSPAISPVGNVVAVSTYGWNGESSVILLNIENGEEKSVYPVKNNSFIKEMAFETEQTLIVLIIGDQGISINRLNLRSGEWTELLPPGPANLTSLSVFDGKIYFESGLNGINNIYRFDPEEGAVYNMTSARFGMFQPAWTHSGKQLFVADYQPNGYTVVSIAEKDLQKEKVDVSSPYTFTLAETVAAQEGFNLDTASLESIPFKSKPYRKLSHLFNVHSWAPFYYDVNEAVSLNTDDFTTIVKPGAMILSQNHLNTTIIQAGAYYKDRNMHGKLYFNYMGWYPVFDVTVDWGGDAWSMTWDKSDLPGRYTTSWAYPGRKQIEIEGRMYIPFNLTRNHYIRGIQPAISYYYTNHRYQQYKSDKMRDFRYVLGELRFYHYRKMAQRDILPRWGYQLRLQYLHTPFQTENFADLYAVRLVTYWPGMLQNHSLMLRAGFQYQPVESKAMYSPKHILEAPRGYEYDYRNYQQYLIRGDYAFSLFCPDVSIGALAYIKRVRTNLFYDMAQTKSKKEVKWTTQSSFGGDLIVDWNIFRLNYPISLGIRIVNPIDYGKVQAEGLFSVSF